jgi:GNAT superfamily N-acetyltransferase
MSIRGITPADISDVLRVQEDAYIPDLLECANTFSRKLTLFPEGCLGYCLEGRLEAYVFSHPWRFGESVPLDQVIAALPENPDCLYIHDMAVGKALQGKGIARALLLELFNLAERMKLKRFALVAVQQSEPFWARWGFRPQHAMIYGKDVAATYMTLVREAP